MTDEAILTLADEHTVCAEDLVDLKLYTSRASASRRLSKLHDEKKLAFFCRYRPKGTKPRYYYTNAEFNLSHKEHECDLSSIAYRFAHHAEEIRRGPDVNQTRLADLEMDFLVGEETVGYDLEFDRETEPQERIGKKKDVWRVRPQSSVATRLKKLKGSGRNVLIVTTGRKARCKNLLATAAKVGVPVYVTTLAEVLANPFGEIWQDGGPKLRQIEPEAVII